MHVHVGGQEGYTEPISISFFAMAYCVNSATECRLSFCMIDSRYFATVRMLTYILPAICLLLRPCARRIRASCSRIVRSLGSLVVARVYSWRTICAIEGLKYASPREAASIAERSSLGGLCFNT